MAQTARTIYDAMEFPPYEYHEYPKWVGNTGPKDKNGHATGGVIVNNKAEEEAYWEEHPDSAPAPKPKASK